jgi:hypothetical protein
MSAGLSLNDRATMLRAHARERGVTPENVRRAADAGQLTISEALIMGDVCAAYIEAGKSSLGPPGLINPVMLLVACYQHLADVAPYSRPEGWPPP